MIFLVFFKEFGAFFLKICAHNERHMNLMAGIFEIRFFLATSRFHCHWSKTDDNGHAILQSCLSKLFKREIG